MVKHDQLVIVDIEATCWENNQNPPGQQSEIIEIGVCTLDLTTGEMGTARSVLVRPARSKVSNFCTQLTTLTQAQVEQGVTFAEACQILKEEYATQARVWGSWGKYDQRMFEEQCASFLVEYPFSQQYINLKQLFKKQYDLQRPIGMEKALEMLQLPLLGTHHRGDDDARNIARITGEMLKTHGRDAFLKK